jgi:hypothetical protein
MSLTRDESVAERRTSTARRQAESLESRLRDTDNLRRIVVGSLSLLLLLYLFIRILIFTRADRDLTLEVIRLQGVSGIAEAAVGSLFTEFLALGLLAGISLTIVGWAKRRLRTGVAGGIIAVVGLLLVPWTFAGFVVIVSVVVVFVFLLSAARGWEDVIWMLPLTVIVVGYVVIAPLFSSPWLPHERVTSADKVYDGYVLGHEGEFTVVVASDPNQFGGDGVAMVDGVTSRMLCEPDDSPGFDSPSVAVLLLKEAGKEFHDTPECANPERHPLPEVDGKVVLCIDATGAITFQEEGASCDVVRLVPAQVGKKGPPGDKGPRGDQGPDGDRGDQGPRGQRGHEGDRGDEGPQGERGERGDKGPQGDRGPRGPQGGPWDPGGCRTPANAAATLADLSQRGCRVPR